MDICQKFLRAVENGSRFKIDFKTRSLRFAKHYLIKDGKFEGDLGIVKSDKDTMIECLNTLYESYYRSLPSERSDVKRGYFIAKPFDRMSHKELLNGVPRELARARLEFYVLALILLNTSWSEIADKGTYYFQKFSSGLVIFKDWFKPEE